MSRTSPLTPPSSPSRRSTSSLLLLNTGNPISAPTANCLADSLGVSPLYRRHESARWQSAAQIYRSYQGSRADSRAHSPAPDTSNDSFFSTPMTEYAAAVYHTLGTPLSLIEIGRANRKRYLENGCTSSETIVGGSGRLELEAIAAVHELSNEVRSISVSDILPRTADLIFVNIKTFEGCQHIAGNPYTLELTMKGWRVASSRCDSMNGDYRQVELHTKYYENARQLLEEISPAHSQCFTKCLHEKLNQLHQWSKAQEDIESKFIGTNHEDGKTKQRTKKIHKTDDADYDSSDEGLVLNFESCS